MPQVPDLTNAEQSDIQRLVLYGTASKYLRYHFFGVSDAARGRSFVESLLPSGPFAVTTAEPFDPKAESLLYVAFTYAGLEALGVPAASLNSFSDEFRAGPKQRAELLGDVGDSAPDHWKFDPDRVHIVVMLYARKLETLQLWSLAIAAAAIGSGCSIVTCLNAAALDDFVNPDGQVVKTPVHFGYSDGISQPEIGPTTSMPPTRPPGVPAGMFLLGHPDPPDPLRNSAANRLCFSIANERVPVPAQLGVNGTFGAFRMLEQDCGGFERFLDSNSDNLNSRELLAARLCGRWRNGVPLALSPQSPFASPSSSTCLPAPAVSVDALNDFDYRDPPAQIDDTAGSRCPIGSHIRRANPRNAQVLGQMGSRVRILRRGLPYGPAYDPCRPHDGEERGLLGLFLGVSLKHQFEFMMTNWMNDGLFARGLSPSEKDPLVGAQVSGATFTYSNTADQSQSVAISRFIRTRGSAYLFFPSVTGIRWIAQQRPVAVETGGESRAIGFIVENMKQRIGTGTRRDAHPKHHGLVRAALEIDANIPPDLRWGIFAAPRTYGAYVRFSNGRPGPDLADNVPDVRGCAIKLLGVEGLKMADDERLTHDFVLASHPVFFVRDVTEYVRFLQTPSSLLPAQFPELMKSFRIFGSPLTIRYFSQTPYALGPHCVKYKLEPIDPAPRDPIDPTAPGLGQKDPNFLRQALAEFLGKSPATFGLCVQLADATQIEDATAAWTSPFTQVATLTIRQQDFTSAPQDAFADAISMSPWHCLFDNRPLGSINRARLQIYQQASPLRHHNGGTSPREPDGINDF